MKYTNLLKFLLYACNFLGPVITLIVIWQYEIPSERLKFPYYFMDVIIPVIDFLAKFGIIVASIIVLTDIGLTIIKKTSYTVAISLCIINIISSVIFTIIIYSMGKSV